jgi:hypothetical protein
VIKVEAGAGVVVEVVEVVVGIVVEAGEGMEV